MDNTTDLTLPFYFRPAEYTADAGNLDTVTLTYHEAGNRARNTTQLNALVQVDTAVKQAILACPGYVNFGVDTFAIQCSCYKVPESARALRSINGEPLFQPYLYLFHTIVALEWEPSPLTRQQLALGMRRASNFLYDVTDGWMAFGQVLIGGPELMDGADIQILASNRLHPRSWIDALNDPGKFKPIRMGRGIWQKNRGILSTLDTPDAYHSLVHEWGHYAFGLADAYLESRPWRRDSAKQRLWQEAEQNDSPSKNGQFGTTFRAGGHDRGNITLDVVLPEIALPVETVMANVEISEFAETDHIRQNIQARYPLVDWGDVRLTGPDELPLPLPIVRSAAASQNGQELAVDVTNLFSGSTAQSHWLYVLKAPFTNGMPARVIGQGKISSEEARNEYRRLHPNEPDSTNLVFRVFGAAQGDTLVAVSGTAGTVTVRQATVGNGAITAWSSATPNCLDQPFFVDVLPGPVVQHPQDVTPPQASVWLHVEATSQPDLVRLYPSGLSDGYIGGLDLNWNKTSGTSSSVAVTHLDGHALLRWNDGTMFICGYSQGGGPATSGGGRPSITAGSSEGNAMLFFRDPVFALAPHQRQKLVNTNEIARQRFAAEEERDKEQKVRVVTTVLPSYDMAVEGQAESRSYVFTFASNTRLHDYIATLVLYYDHGAPKYGGDLLIYRWSSHHHRWERLTTIAPTELAYIAIPVRNELETAPGLTKGLKISDEQTVYLERYQIFWAPDGQRHGTTT